MNPIRRELLNGVLVLVVASLLSVAFEAFQIRLNLQLWILILIGVGVAVTGYIVFEIAVRYMAASQEREKEWLQRVGTPARFEVNDESAIAGAEAIGRAIQSIRPGSDYTSMVYVGSETYSSLMTKELSDVRERDLRLILEQQRRGIIREYKRIICFDAPVLANDVELRSGILRVGEGRGTIDRPMGEHCRQLLQTKGCSLFVAPAVMQASLFFLGTSEAAMSVETAGTSGRVIAGVMFFYDPPNSEIIERFRQIERTTERRMVAVHKIRLPEDESPTAEAATS